MRQVDLDRWHMSRALELAARGRGSVEPNPMVGCIIARGAEIIGEGWHRSFGGPHAEIDALAIAGPRAAGSSLYVTLEPCCHHGKTPPCSQAIIQAGIARAIVAQSDPFAQVAGGGIAELNAAGIAVEVGLLEDKARHLNAPYLKLLDTGRPWVIAKWAMTLDGKIATRTGASRWISSAASRAIVHDLRGRVDAIIVGRNTALADDPLLTARPPGPRIATRIVLDRHAALPVDSQLASTAGNVPCMIAVAEDAPLSACDRLRAAGCELFTCHGDQPIERLASLLDELGRRKMTNVLFEGGATVFGTLLEMGAVDEVHVFIAPKLLGGAAAPGPIAGLGFVSLEDAFRLQHIAVSTVDGDLYLRGRVAQKKSTPDSTPPSSGQP